MFAVYNYHPKNQILFGKCEKKKRPNNNELITIQTELEKLAKEFSPDSVANDKQFIEKYVALRKTCLKIGEQAGFKSPSKVPRMLETDAYTAANSGYISQDAKDYSCYQITFRREITPWMKDFGLDEKDCRYVFFGLQQIMANFLQNPVTKEEIDEADEFFKTARGGQQFKWDRKVWDKVVDENNGIIPVKIEALPDGSVIFPGEPVVQISAKDGYGELAAWFETKILQIWATSERATLLRYLLEYNKNLVKQCADITQPEMTDDQVTAKAQLMFADFSDRSSMTAQESEYLGLASITSFPTTSTLSAAYRAYKESNDNQAARASMYSLAHRTVQSYKKEGDAYNALYNYAQGIPASYVGDCYDYRRAVEKHLLPLALDAKAKGLNTIVYARPDSGDAVAEILFTLNKAVDAGLCRKIKTKNGELTGMTNLRVIEADGINFKTMKKINDALLANGFSPPDCIAYGIGGYLHDSLSRGNLSAAQKLCAVGVDKNYRPVMKSPRGEAGKESIPGEVKIVRETDSSGKTAKPTVRSLNENGKNAMVTQYDGIDDCGIIYKEDFRNVQKRVIKEFLTFPKPSKNNLLSEGIIRAKIDYKKVYCDY